MKTKTINLYEIEELNEKAREKAFSQLREFISDNKFLKEELTEHTKELLLKEGIEYFNLEIFYSLGCCQGDGVMFEGRFSYKGNIFIVKQSGRYYHYNSKIISGYNNDSGDETTTEEENDFNEIYVDICKSLEKLGYSNIEYNNSEINLIEMCKANEYIFQENGLMEKNEEVQK